MPDPQVVFIRGDVDSEEYRQVLDKLFGNRKYPTIKTDDPRYTRLHSLAHELGVEDPFKVFYFGSQSPAFKRFQSSPDYYKYRMAHLDTA